MSNMVWYSKEGQNGDIVISSRIRLARNLPDVPFPIKLNREVAQAVISRIVSAVEKTAELSGYNFQFLDLAKLSRVKKLSLLERHLVSPDLIQKNSGAALLSSADESVSIMVNEEDHLRLQVMEAGFGLKDIYSLADGIDSHLDSKLKFAFDDSFGYLTQCPTNLGTGMRASLMLHLPALKRTGAISKVMKNLFKLGLTMRGMYGEGTEPVGDMYQLSNQVTLGISEKAAIKNLEDISMQLINQEKTARNELRSSLSVQDEIHRSFGLLSNCRLLGANEFMSLVSNVRLGVAVQEIANIPFSVLNSLMFKVQAANICSEYGEETGGKEQNRIRAEIVRKILGEY